jgi:hypothetical protein
LTSQLGLWGAPDASFTSKERRKVNEQRVNLPTDLDAAIREYLESVAGYENYLKATENLFNVFVKGWCGSRRDVAEAFTAFRRTLVGGNQTSTMGGQ